MPWLLIGVIVVLIFIGWILNIRYVLQRHDEEDEFISIIKTAIFEVNKSFDNSKKELQNYELPDPSTQLDEEVLQKLKEKILLQENAKK